MTPDEKRAHHAAKMRERYQSDPEYRERVKAKVTARRHADPEKARLQSLEDGRRMREAKPDYYREYRAQNTEYVERERDRRHAAYIRLKAERGTP